MTTRQEQVAHICRWCKITRTSGACVQVGRENGEIIAAIIRDCQGRAIKQNACRLSDEC
jgi:hypothetical protein